MWYVLNLSSSLLHKIDTKVDKIMVDMQAWKLCSMYGRKGNVWNMELSRVTVILEKNVGSIWSRKLSTSLWNSIILLLSPDLFIWFSVPTFSSTYFHLVLVADTMEIRRIKEFIWREERGTKLNFKWSGGLTSWKSDAIELDALQR